MANLRSGFDRNFNLVIKASFASFWMLIHVTEGHFLNCSCYLWNDVYLGGWQLCVLLLIKRSFIATPHDKQQTKNTELEPNVHCMY